MFDFERWRRWLKDEAEKLRADGFSMDWKPNDRYLRGTSLEGVGHGLIGSFRNFENGLVDYEVFSEQADRFLVNRATIEVNDENFVAVFEEFKRDLGLRI